MSGMGNIFEMMKNAREMMEKAKTSQAELAKRLLEGSAGAGMVTATVNGIGELVGLKFDKSVINPEDPEMLADLIIAAVADARKKTGDLRNEALKDLAGGVDLSSLGIELPNIF